MKTVFAAALSALLLLSPAAQAASDAPFLYEIQGAKAKHYLLGSVHLLPASSQPLPTALTDAYRAAAGVTFESDLATLADPKSQLQMLQSASIEQGLKAVVGKDVWERLQQRSATTNMPLDQTCAPYKAWFCAMTLEVYAFQRAGFSPEYGLDQYFFNRALNDGKAIHWLESPDAHMALFTQMPDKLGEHFLNATLDEETEAGQQPEALLKMWRDGDKVELERLTHEFKLRHPDVYARLLADRSRAWLTKLEPLLAGDAPQLIVVGAAHLTGSDGLLALLKAKGYEIHPVGSDGLRPTDKTADKSRDPRPPATPWLTPWLNVRDIDAALAFYQAAFGFEPGELHRDDKGRLSRAALKYHDSSIVLQADATPRTAAANGVKSPATAQFYVYVNDVDALAARAKKAGADILSGPADQLGGDRGVQLRDPDGYLWTFATRLPMKLSGR